MTRSCETLPCFEGPAIGEARHLRGRSPEGTLRGRHALALEFYRNVVFETLESYVPSVVRYLVRRCCRPSSVLSFRRPLKRS